MKIDTDNTYELEIYGLSVADMVDLADLPSNTEYTSQNNCFYTKGRYGEWEEIRTTKDFVERTISLADTDCELEDKLFEENYIAYTCFLREGRLEVTTDSNTRPIPQGIVDKLIIFCLFYELKFETKKLAS